MARKTNEEYKKCETPKQRLVFFIEEYVNKGKTSNSIEGGITGVERAAGFSSSRIKNAKVDISCSMLGQIMSVFPDLNPMWVISGHNPVVLEKENKDVLALSIADVMKEQLNIIREKDAEIKTLRDEIYALKHENLNSVPQSTKKQSVQGAVK